VAGIGFAVFARLPCFFQISGWFVVMALAALGRFDSENSWTKIQMVCLGDQKIQKLLKEVESLEKMIATIEKQQGKINDLTKTKAALIKKLKNIAVTDNGKNIRGILVSDLNCAAKTGGSHSHD